MRQIFGQLTDELNKHTTPKTVGKDPAYVIKNYRELAEQVAKLSFLNKDHLLFYRGQHNNYENKAGVSSFYPTIYRGDYLTQQELNYRFDLLNSASKLLIEAFKKNKIDGYTLLLRKKYIQWSLLQHYNVTCTPLIDVSQSLRVACSFALLYNKNKSAYIYVFGLPYFSNRISVNSEHDLVNIRLLSISPPSALRPYFQEGYLIGTDDITNEYATKSELDLNQRLIAKFEIPNTKKFWNSGFDAIPKDALYPDKDFIEDICNNIKQNLKAEIGDNEIGRFLKLWSEVEKLIIEDAKKYQRNVFNLRNALILVRQSEQVDYNTIKKIDQIRSFRNKLVHNPASVSKDEVYKMISELELTLADYKKSQNN